MSREDMSYVYKLHIIYVQNVRRGVLFGQAKVFLRLMLGWQLKIKLHFFLKG